MISGSDCIGYNVQIIIKLCIAPFFVISEIVFTLFFFVYLRNKQNNSHKKSDDEEDSLYAAYGLDGRQYHNCPVSL